MTTTPASFGLSAAQPLGLVNISTSGPDVVALPALRALKVDHATICAYAARRVDAVAPALAQHVAADLVVNSELARLRRMKRRVCKAANIHDLSDTTGLRPALITLTYRPGVEWSPRQISDCLRLCRKWCKRRGFTFRYVWTAELQSRGAVHYHLVGWFPDSGSHRPPFFDKRQWWPHGMTQAEWARNAVGYIVKYASKIASKDRLPQGARMHGSGGFTKDERAHLKHHGLPTWLRDRAYAGQNIEKLPGGIAVQQYACGIRRAARSPFIKIGTRSGSVLLIRRPEGTRLSAETLKGIECKTLSHSQHAATPNPKATPSFSTYMPTFLKRAWSYQPSTLGSSRLH